MRSPNHATREWTTSPLKVQDQLTTVPPTWTGTMMNATASPSREGELVRLTINSMERRTVVKTLTNNPLSAQMRILTEESTLKSKRPLVIFLVKPLTDVSAPPSRAALILKTDTTE